MGQVKLGLGLFALAAAGALSACDAKPVVSEAHAQSFTTTHQNQQLTPAQVQAMQQQQLQQQQLLTQTPQNSSGTGGTTGQLFGTPTTQSTGGTTGQLFNTPGTPNNTQAVQQARTRGDIFAPQVPNPNVRTRGDIFPQRFPQQTVTATTSG